MVTANTRYTVENGDAYEAVVGRTKPVQGGAPDALTVKGKRDETTWNIEEHWDGPHSSHTTTLREASIKLLLKQGTITPE